MALFRYATCEQSYNLKLWLCLLTCYVVNGFH